MNETGTNRKLVLEADRKPAAFRSIPEDTQDLTITTLLPSETTELLLLGHRLKRLTKQTLRYGLLEHLGFLESFRSIRSLFVGHLSDLKDFNGISHCVNLTQLGLTASLSSIGSLAFLRHLPELEELSLEGPNPSKGMDKLEPLQKVRKLNLYSARWRMDSLPVIFPALEDLSISQGGYLSLDFITSLDKLMVLDIAYARKPVVFDAVGKLPRPHSLQIGHGIRGLQSCSQFGHSASIERLRINNCTQLNDVCSLVDWPALRKAEIYDCPLVPIAQIKRLRQTGKVVNGK